MKRITLLGTVFAVGLVAVGLAVAAANRNWSTHANGAAHCELRSHRSPVRTGNGDAPTPAQRSALVRVGASAVLPAHHPEEKP